ncbi:MAG: glycosyltransferase family 9 protein [Acidobacteriota bacterium]
MRRELEQADRMLLIRLRSLGDSILTLPLLDALHTWRPVLGLDVLIETHFAPVFRHHPAVREVLTMRSRQAPGVPGWSKSEAARGIRRRRYPVVLNLHGGTTSLFLSLASGAGRRIGQRGFRASWCYNAHIPHSSGVWGRAKIHTIEHQLTLARWLRIPITDAARPNLFVAEDARRDVGVRLSESGIRPNGYVLIQPTATLFTKQWPEHRFAELADRLADRFSLPVLFSAGSRESAVLERIRSQACRRHLYWSDLPLQALFALIEGCRLFVGNDSGPTHAAAALRRPLVVVWGSSDYDVWRPWGTDNEIVRSALPCMPCPGYSCEEHGDPRCILDIGADAVLEACERMMSRSAAASGGNNSTSSGSIPPCAL